VICSFRPDYREQTASEVATATGLDRAGARRMLRTLESLGYVRSEGAKFQLTPRVLDLSRVYLTSSPLRSVAEPVAEKLASAVQEFCSVSVLDGTAIVHVVTVPINRIMSVNLPVGTRLPAYCTAPGRILLGCLPEGALDATLRNSNLKKHTKHTVTSVTDLKRIIRRDHNRGWSLLNQEFEEGIGSLSVPIVERSGQIIAAMNVAGNLSRTPAQKMISKVLPRLKEAAHEIHSLLNVR
jgi:IclR family pca regulon transcriptional regulator